MPFMKSKAPDRGGLVYSTEAGRMCPACRRPIAQLRLRGGPPRPTGGGRHRARCARNQGPRRQGRDAGARDWTWMRPALARLAQQLKAACGSGGTVKDGVIEVQGEHRDRVIELLAAQGYTVKRAGG